MNLSEANRPIIFIKVNRLESSLIITSLARRIAFGIFGKVNLWTRLEHRIIRKANLLSQGESPQVNLSEVHCAAAYAAALCWRAHYCSRCTPSPSRGRQRRSPFNCWAHASRPATCSARGQAAEPFPLFSPARLPVFLRPPEARRSMANYFAASCLLVVRRRALPDTSPGACGRGGLGGTPSAQILAKWPGLSPYSLPRARDPVRSTILPPWLGVFSLQKQRAFAAQQCGRGIVLAALWHIILWAETNAAGF